MQRGMYVAYAGLVQDADTVYSQVRHLIRYFRGNKQDSDCYAPYEHLVSHSKDTSYRRSLNTGSCDLVVHSDAALYLS